MIITHPDQRWYLLQYIVFYGQGHPIQPRPSASQAAWIQSPDSDVAVQRLLDLVPTARSVFIHTRGAADPTPHDVADIIVGSSFIII